MIRRSSLIVLPLAAGALAGGPGVAGAASPAPVRATLGACHRGLAAIDRSFDTDAAMQAIGGTRRMGIRFELQERRPAQLRYHRVTGAGFGVWYRSRRGVGAYRYARTTNNLAAPAFYRMRVGFRWYGRRGRVLRTVSRLTAPCFQPDMRPDLAVRRLAVTPKTATQDEYAVRIVNRGRTATTKPFDVTLAFPSGLTRRKRVQASLAPGAATTRRFAGPLCGAGAPTLTLDAADEIGEAREGNNTRVFPCP